MKRAFYLEILEIETEFITICQAIWQPRIVCTGAGAGSSLRGSGEGSEGSGEGLGGFGAEPGQVQQGSGEG